MVSLCTSSPTNRVDCSMDPSPVPEAPRQTIRRDPRSSTHRDDGSPLQAGYGHEVFCGGFAPHKPLIRCLCFEASANKRQLRPARPNFLLWHYFKCLIYRDILANSAQNCVHYWLQSAAEITAVVPC